ncbi:MAG: phosphoribosylanthranilate isomerase [Syntrophobacterales bacterium]|nr:phosphoribosylanthranilate isomerase [Syntrophobacterales bacterium]
MTEIKICGITNSEDALAAAALGANALGFIFQATSPRYISPIEAKEIIELLPPAITRVGVFVNSGGDEVKKTADICGLDIIQLHGDESPEYCRRFPPKSLVKAVFLSSNDDLACLGSYHVRAFLADSRHDGRYGGTGRKANWELAARAAEKYPLILAGGLSETNIAAALTKVKPAAVDINSGIEKAPGIKDHERMRQLIAVVKNHDRASSGGGSTAANGIFAHRGLTSPAIS